MRPNRRFCPSNRNPHQGGQKVGTETSVLLFGATPTRTASTNPKPQTRRRAQRPGIPRVVATAVLALSPPGGQLSCPAAALGAGTGVYPERAARGLPVWGAASAILMVLRNQTH